MIARVCFWGIQTKTMGFAHLQVDTSILWSSLQNCWIYFALVYFLARGRKVAEWRNRDEDVWVSVDS